MNDLAFRVWKMRFSDHTPSDPSFCVNAASPGSATAADGIATPGKDT